MLDSSCVCGSLSVNSQCLINPKRRFRNHLPSHAFVSMCKVDKLVKVKREDHSSL